MCVGAKVQVTTGEKITCSRPVFLSPKSWNNREMVDSESFTRWLRHESARVGESARVQEQCFSIPTVGVSRGYTNHHQGRGQP